jgi:hypothetical protein
MSAAWYNQGILSKLPSELTLVILEYIHPLYPKIHREIERLNKTLRNIDKYYLSGNIIPSPKKTPYDPKTNYSIKFDIADFAILAYLLPIYRGSIFKEITFSKCGETDNFSSIEDIGGNIYIPDMENHPIPIKINIRRYYMSRERSLLCLFVAGFKCQTKGYMHYFKTPQDENAGKYSIDYKYFKGGRYVNKITKNHYHLIANGLYTHPVFDFEIETLHNIRKDAWNKTSQWNNNWPCGNQFRTIF